MVGRALKAHYTVCSLFLPYSVFDCQSTPFALFLLHHVFIYFSKISNHHLCLQPFCFPPTLMIVWNLFVITWVAYRTGISLCWVERYTVFRIRSLNESFITVNFSTCCKTKPSWIGVQSQKFHTLTTNQAVHEIFAQCNVLLNLCKGDFFRLSELTHRMRLFDGTVHIRKYPA